MDQKYDCLDFVLPIPFPGRAHLVCGQSMDHGLEEEEDYLLVFSAGGETCSFYEVFLHPFLKALALGIASKLEGLVFISHSQQSFV